MFAHFLKRFIVFCFICVCVYVRVHMRARVCESLCVSLYPALLWSYFTRKMDPLTEGGWGRGRRATEGASAIQPRES